MQSSKHSLKREQTLSLLNRLRLVSPVVIGLFLIYILTNFGGMDFWMATTVALLLVYFEWVVVTYFIRICEAKSYK